MTLGLVDGWLMAAHGVHLSAGLSAERYVMYERVYVCVRFVRAVARRGSTWIIRVMPRVQPAVEHRQRHVLQICHKLIGVHIYSSRTKIQHRVTTILT